jgi:protein-disulfide isomerase
MKSTLANFESAREKSSSSPILALVALGLVGIEGSTDASFVVTLLFDYKCPHCQPTPPMHNHARQDALASRQPTPVDIVATWWCLRR